MRGASSCALRRFWACVLLVAGLVAPAAAQVTTGGVNGTVTDESGGVLPGVTVSVRNLATGLVRTDVTNEAGRYQVTGLQPSRYSVSAELAGFSTVVREVTVNLGSAIDVNLTMAVGALQETVTVSGEAPLVQSAKTDLANIVTREVLESLPSKNQQYLDFALLMPAASENVTRVQGTGAVIGGARSKEGTLLVDGFYNLDEGFTMPKQRHSQDTIQEFQLVTFGGAAEFGRAIGGVINAVTKSGSNELSGSAYGYFRDTSMNAQSFEERLRGSPKSPFTRQQWGGSLGGPIKREKSFFFVSFERIDEDAPYDNGITEANALAIGLPREDYGTVPRFNRSYFAFGRWDHNISAEQRLQASFSVTDATDHQMSQLFPLATRSYVQQLPFLDFAYVAGWTKLARGGRMLHEVKASYFPRDYHSNGLPAGGPPLVPDGQINRGDQGPSSPPTVTISSVANFGSATLQNHIKTYPVQGIYTSSIFTDRHTVKFGVDYMYAYYDYNQFSPLKGRYSFSSLANFQRGAYTQYTQAFGDVANPRTHQYISGFVQDSWHVNNRLTMNYGLRYDLELNPAQERSGIPFGNDYNNVGPRLGLSYDLTGKGSTFVKLTSGVYYDRIWNNTTNDLYDLKDHQLRESATWRPQDPGAPVYPQTFTERPAVIPRGVIDVIVMPEEVKVPASAQVIATLEHALTPNIAVTASGIYTRSWNKEYRWDNNLEWDGTRYVRPDPNYRQIRQYRFDAPAEYAGGIVEVNARGARIGFNGSLTVARSYETLGVFSFPNDQNAGIDADWGPMPDTPRVRGVLSGWYNVTPRIQVSGSFRARTGLPVNPAASGLDLNGDGRTGDRTPTLGPFSFTAPGTHSADVRLTWNLPIRGDKRRLQFFAEVFNVYDEANVRTVDNNFGPNPAQPGPNWLVARSYFPPREVQLGMKFVF